MIKHDTQNAKCSKWLLLAPLAVLILVCTLLVLTIGADLVFVLLSPSDAEQLHMRAEAEMREVTAALEDFKRRQGEYPAALSELVRMRVPNDPFTGKG